MTPNFRDVGNLITTEGRVLRSGKLLRSAVPREDDHGPDGVEWPPSVVIDLRSAGELEPVHPLAAAGARVVNLPLLAALRPGAEMPQSLVHLYQVMLQDSSAYLVDLVRHVALAPGAALIHCAAGKDRTGVSIALLLRLAQVPREVVLEDYLLTNEALADIDARLRPKVPRSTRRAYPPGFHQVMPEALNGVLDAWDAHEGGVHGWFVNAGGQQDDVDALRRTLLV